MKKSLAVMLALIMVLCMIPTTALAKLDTGHKIDVRFTVLYVGDEFNIGYNYGASEKTQFVCQYSTPHSDTAYNNHTIAISDIKAAADRATVNSGYQIVGWSKESNANPTVWPLNKSGTTACNKGTTIYLVAKNPNPQPTKPTKPSDDAIPGIVDNDAVKVHCTNSAANHTDIIYSLKPNSYTVSEVEGDATNGYTCTITVQSDEYVSAYNKTYSGHTLDGSPTGTIKLKWNENKWKVDSGVPVVFNVKCETQEPPTDNPPAKPEPENTSKPVVGLTGKEVVEVECITENSGHNKQAYQLIEGSYEVGNVEGDATSGYTCTITVQSEKYVNDYNAGINVNHTLDGSPTGKIKLEWDKDNQKWKLATPSGVPVVFTVKCETQEPPTDTPNPPADIKELVGSSNIQVQCTTANTTHPIESYSLLDESYTTGTVTKDGDAYTCTITVDPAKYVAEYNKTHGDHKLNPNPQNGSITFKWENDKWTLLAGQNLPITFTVVHDTQEPPTPSPSENPNPTPTPTPGGGNGGGGHSHYYPTTTPVPVIVIPPKTGDMTIWQSILHFLGIR